MFNYLAITFNIVERFTKYISINCKLFNLIVNILLIKFIILVVV